MSTDSIDSTAASVRSAGSITALHWIGIALAAVTGGIHLWLGLTGSKPALVVAGAGFAVGISAAALDVRRESVVALGVPYVAAQIALYAVGHGVVGPGPVTVSPIGLADKVIQTALLAVLVVLGRRG